MARSHILCPERQSMQNALLCQKSESTHNHRQSVYKLIFILLFLLTFSAIFRRCLSAIMRFLPSASWVVFSAHLCFQDNFLKTSPLVSAFTKRRQSSATLRYPVSLPTKRPTVVGRWMVLSIGFDGVGLTFTP